MKVHLIKKQTIEDYILRNARSKASFEIWFSILRNDRNGNSEIYNNKKQGAI